MSNLFVELSGKTDFCIGKQCGLVKMFFRNKVEPFHHIYYYQPTGT